MVVTEPSVKAMFAFSPTLLLLPSSTATLMALESAAVAVVTWTLVTLLGTIAV